LTLDPREQAVSPGSRPCRNPPDDFPHVTPRQLVGRELDQPAYIDPLVAVPVSPAVNADATAVDVSIALIGRAGP
jgi:hypothetical protein